MGRWGNFSHNLSFLLCKMGISGFLEDWTSHYSYFISLLSLVERIVSPRKIQVLPHCAPLTYPPNSWKRDVIWEWMITDVKVKSCWNRAGPNPMTDVLIRKEKGTWRQETPCELEAEVRVLNPGEEHRRFPVTTRIWKEARKIPPLEPSEEAPPCWQLDFRPLAPRTGRQYIPIVLGYSVCGHLLQKPWEPGTPPLLKSHLFLRVP